MKNFRNVFLFIIFVVLLSGCSLIDDKPDAAMFEEDEYKIERGEAIIIEVHSFSGEHLVIPDEIDGSPVKEIMSNAFSNYTQIEHITISSNVRIIGSEAFINLENLETITFEKGRQLKTIGDGAFRGAESLTTVNIPSSVTSIGEDAFLGASSLTIYTEHEEKPYGWQYNWNPDDLDVIWGYEQE